MTDQNGVTVLIGYRRKQCHPQAAEIEGFGNVKFERATDISRLS